MYELVYDLKGAKVELIVTPGFSPGYSSGSPSLRGSSPTAPGLSTFSHWLLLSGRSPPSTCGREITLVPLTEHAQDIFGFNCRLADAEVGGKSTFKFGRIFEELAKGKKKLFSDKD